MEIGFAHEMEFGAHMEAGGTRFRLWAPSQRNVRLVLEPADRERRLPMARGDDGWFECTTDAACAGSRYLFALDDGMRVPDPASRFQPEDVHAASEVIDPRAYAWQHPAWRGRPWRETVLYEAHVGAFSPSGDYAGVQAKLDHLAKLGVTALELMPLADFEGKRNWGYDGVLPFAPDSGYGRPEALKRLVDAAHARGLMVFLDVVYNHFGPSGNYLHLYAPQFFTEREHTPWGAAIDFSQRTVRDFFIHNALYWLCEYRFDGLRLDAVDQIRDTGQPHILEEIASAVRAHCGDRDVHLVLENDHNASRYLARSGAPGPGTGGWGPESEWPTGEPDFCRSAPARDRPGAAHGRLHAGSRAEQQGENGRAQARSYDAQWNDDFHHAAHRLATGEAHGYYVDYPHAVAALARALAEGFVYQGEHSAYRDHARGEPSGALPPLAFVDFLQNHDQVGNRAFGERLDALADARAVEALLAILLLAPSVPLLFMGEAWGSAQPWLFFCDYHDGLADAVRDGRRREFARFPAFADRAARARIPDPNDEATFAASRLDWRDAETEAGRQRLDLVRRLLGIRRREIVPRLDESLHGGQGEVANGGTLRVAWELVDGSSLHLVANPTASAVAGLAWNLPGRLLYACPDSVDPHHIAALPPWSAAWSCQ